MVFSARQFILCLLVAMIPMKGFAAAMMLYCGAAYERGAAVAHEAGMHGQDHGTHQAALPPCHTEAADLTDDPTHPASADSSCSLCAVCSSASNVIHRQAPTPGPVPTAGAPWFTHTAGFTGHIPPPLDRPPL